MTYKHGFVDDYPYLVGATDPEFAVSSSANFAAFKSTVEGALTEIGTDIEAIEAEIEDLPSGGIVIDDTSGTLDMKASDIVSACGDAPIVVKVANAGGGYDFENLVSIQSDGTAYTFICTAYTISDSTITLGMVAYVAATGDDYPAIDAG